MAETIPVSVQSLSQRLEILAAAEPSPFPVVSLYLDLSAVNNGRENYETFIRKAFAERAKGLPADSPERQSFEQERAHTSAPQGTPDENRLKLSDELVTRAHQTAARVRFIEDPDLLADVGGVGALLRFRI